METKTVPSADGVADFQKMVEGFIPKIGHVMGEPAEGGTALTLAASSSNGPIVTKLNPGLRAMRNTPGPKVQIMSWVSR